MKTNIVTLIYYILIDNFRIFKMVDINLHRLHILSNIRNSSNNLAVISPSL